MRRKRSKSSITNILEALPQDSTLPPKDLQSILKVLDHPKAFIQPLFHYVFPARLLDGIRGPTFFANPSIAYNEPYRS